MNAFKRGTLQLSRTGASHSPTTRITVYHEIIRQIDEPAQGLQIAPPADGYSNDANSSSQIRKPDADALREERTRNLPTASCRRQGLAQA